MLLDEPTIGLDVDAARTVREWVVRLARDEGRTIVLTTHQLAMAEQVCDRVAVIRDGRIVTDLPTGQLLDRYIEDRFAVEVLGDPVQLARALPAGTRIESSTAGSRSSWRPRIRTPCMGCWPVYTPG